MRHRPPRAVVTNLDDEHGAQLAEFSRKRSSSGADLWLGPRRFPREKPEVTPRGTRFDMVTPQEKLPVFSPLIGRVNVYNILAAAAAGFARGCDGEAISAELPSLDSRPRDDFSASTVASPSPSVVDYAHTDDALRNLTAFAREFVSRDGGSAPE